MSKQVKILSGVSGSGKSTYAHSLVTNDGGSIVSADYFFMQNGKYNFNVNSLSAAHGACFRGFIDAMRDNLDLIVVDNTTTEEIAPYVLGAQAFGYECEIITVSIRDEIDGIQKCAERNSHGVPFKSIAAQQSRLAARKLLPWWNAKTVPARFY